MFIALPVNKAHTTPAGVVPTTRKLGSIHI